MNNLRREHLVQHSPPDAKHHAHTDGTADITLTLPSLARPPTIPLVIGQTVTFCLIFPDLLNLEFFLILCFYLRKSLSKLNTTCNLLEVFYFEIVQILSLSDHLGLDPAP